MSGPLVRAFSFCFASDRRKPIGCRGVPDNPERENLLHCLLHTAPQEMQSWSTGEDSLPWYNRGKAELVLETTQASVASAKDLPLERAWMYCCYSGWILRNLLRSLNVRAHVSDHPKGCLQTFAKQTRHAEQSQNCIKPQLSAMSFHQKHLDKHTP